MEALPGSASHKGVGLQGRRSARCARTARKARLPFLALRSFLRRGPLAPAPRGRCCCLHCCAHCLCSSSTLHRHGPSQSQLFHSCYSFLLKQRTILVCLASKRACDGRWLETQATNLQGLALTGSSAAAAWRAMLPWRHCLSSTVVHYSCERSLSSGSLRLAACTAAGS